MNYDINTEQGMANAIAWTNGLLSKVRQGGTWFVPRSSTAYVVDHAAKTITTNYGAEACIVKVLEAGGWTVNLKAPQ